MKQFLFLALLIPTILSAQTRYAATTLRLRAEPSPAATILTTIPAGAAVEIHSCEFEGGDWCSVTYSRTDGYVAAKYLLLSAPKVLASTRATVSSSKSKATSSSSKSKAVASSSKNTPRRSSAESRGYYTGPRGGCYTYSASGRKRYVDRSYCN